MISGMLDFDQPKVRLPSLILIVKKKKKNMKLSF